MGYYLRFAIYLTLLLTSFAVAWFGLKNYAESQPPSKYQTPLVKKLSALKKPIQWVQATQVKQKHPYQWLQAEFVKQNWIATQTNQLLLADAIDLNQAQFLVLQIKFNSPSTLPLLRTTLNEKKRWEKIIICSNTDGILKDLRRLEPDWTFCSGEILMTRLLSFSSIQLGGLVTIKPDIFFLHLKNIELSKSLQPAIDEAHRQNKMVFVGPVTGPKDGYDVDGWVIEKENSVANQSRN